MAEKKLSYKEIPKAVWYVIKSLWQFSPSYVIVSVLLTFKDRIVPFITLFLTAEITTQLPGLLGDQNNILTVIWLLAFMAAVELGSRYVDLLLSTHQQKAENKVSLQLREHFYGAYARLPYRLYEDKEVIDAYQYAETFMYRFSRFGFQQLTRAAGSALELVVAIAALVAVAWFMPLVFLLFTPFLVAAVLKLNREQSRLFHENRSVQRKLWAVTNQFEPRRIKETRLYGVVTHFLAERRKYSATIEKSELDIQLRRDRLGFGQELQVQAAGLVASGVAVWRIATQGAPLGIFVLASQLTSKASGAIQSLFNEISDFDQDLYGFAEYRYITETLQPPEKQLPAAPARPHIQLNDVTFTYAQTKTRALSGVNLDIPYGQSLAIVGENGAGKTTLTRLLLGLYQPQQGTIVISGTSLSELDEATWLSKIGVLLQDFGMDTDMTIRDVVWLGDITRPKNDAAIVKVLRDVGLDDVIKNAPKGIDTYLGTWIEKDNSIELSGGQLQRLAIARALFRDPDVLILDEPTSAIDANAEERIFQHLMASRRGKTTVFVSHRFSTVRRAEVIAYMEKGKLIEYGTHKQLMAKKGKYAAMFTTQAEGYK